MRGQRARVALLAFLTTAASDDLAPKQSQAGGQAQPAEAAVAVRMEILRVKIETDISDRGLRIVAKPIDARKMKFVVLTVRVQFPAGASGNVFSTKDSVLEYRSLGELQKQECEGFRLPSGGWMFVRRDQGMSSLSLSVSLPAGATIDIGFLFVVPKEIAHASFLFRGAAVGTPVEVPLQ